MRKKLLLNLLVVVVVALLGTSSSWNQLRRTPSPARARSNSTAARPITVAVAPAGAHPIATPPEFAAFNTWCERYVADVSGTAVDPSFVEAGRTLATARRSKLSRLIRENPAQALAVSVPAAIANRLPAPVRDRLETPFSARGNFLVLHASTVGPGQSPVHSNEERRLMFADAVYAAHVYGSTLGQTTQYGVELRGIALDGEAALLDVPDRALAADAEAAPSPTGTKRLLVIRADFGDRPGEPVPFADATRLLTEQVAPHFLRHSLGALQLSATVSTQVYRLAANSATYTTTGDTLRLQQDARTAAAADYDLTGFSFIVVVFPNLTSTGKIFTGFEFGGLAELGGVNSWINGRENFTAQTIEHELGHNLGLGHANSLNASESAASLTDSLDYGDLQDTMGAGTDHYNPALQDKLGWISADAAVSLTAGEHTLRLYAQKESTGAAPTPVAAHLPSANGTTLWIFPRATVSGTGVSVVVATASSRVTATLNLTTGTGVSQFMAAGDYFADLSTNALIQVQAVGSTNGVPYADCVVTVPASPPGVAGTPQFVSAPAITDVSNGVQLDVGVAGGTSVRWQKRLFGSSTWTDLETADISAQPTATSIVARRDRGMADLRCVATAVGGEAISNPVRLLGASLLAPVAVSLGASTQRYPLVISASGAWTLTTTADWITCFPSSGSGPQTVMVNVPENFTGSPRSGQVRLGNSSQAVAQSAAASETAQIFATGIGALGAQVASLALPSKLGGGFTGMTSPGIFQKSDGSRWALGRQMMKNLAADWMSTPSFNVDRIAHLGRLIRVPDDVVAFANDLNNGFRYLVLKSNGSLYSIASDTFLGADSYLLATPVATDAVRLACGSTVASYINSKGELWAWGRNVAGEIGDGTTTPRPAPVFVASGVATISAATHQHWFVDTEGQLKGMGKECYSDLGTPRGFDTGVKKVAAGGVHTVILKTDGTVWTVGRNVEGQLGDGTWNSRDTPVKIASDIRDVSIGLNTTYLLRNDGVLLSCGWNRYGQLGDGLFDNRNHLLAIDRDVAALAENIYLKTDGTLWVTGGSLDAPARPTADDHGWYRAGGPAKKIAAGRTLSWMLDATSHLWVSGLVGEGDATPTSDWQLVESEVQDISPGNVGTDWLAFRKSNGESWAITWTSNLRFNRINFGLTANQVFFMSESAEREALVIRNDGALWTASWDGDSDNGTYFARYDEKVADHIVSAAHNSFFRLYVTASGDLWKIFKMNGPAQKIAAGIVEVQSADYLSCFYRSAAGGLDGFNSGDATPHHYADGVTAFSVSPNHVAFQTIDGGIWGFGSNPGGQLGPDGVGGTIATPIALAARAEAFAAAPAGTIVLARGRDLSRFVSAEPFVQLQSSGNGGVSRQFFAAVGLPSAASVPGYRWQHFDSASGQWIDFSDDASIAGSLTANLTLQNLGPLANGELVRCLVTTGSSAVASEVSLIALAPSDSRFTNLSVRSALEVGQTLIVGFNTSGPKAVVVRAAGPALLPFGLAGYLADPRLKVFSGAGALVNENEDWNSALAPVFSQFGMFAFPMDSKDAATLISVSGSQTGQITGQGSGIALAEVYEADSNTNHRLTNLSVRGAAGTGANTLIAGFVISGTMPKRVLVRAIGPSLQAFGVVGALSDPSLAVFRGQEKIADNEDWNSALTPVFTQAGTFPLETGSKDAALALTLEPGAYSVQVSGTTGTTGEALIEVYELP